MWDPTKENSPNNISDDNKFSEVKKIDFDINHHYEDDVNLEQQDSGIISSSSKKSRDNIQDSKGKGSLAKEIPTDSGVVDDLEPSGEISDLIEIDTKTNNLKIVDDAMLVDSGVVVDTVSERLLCLTLNQSLNNLDNPKLQLLETNTTSLGGNKPGKSHPELDNWEKHYQQDDDGETHLHLAIIHEYFEVQMALLRLAPAPCLLDIQNVLFQSPLHLAVLTKQPVTVRKLLLAGADANIKDRHGNSPLHLACINGDLNCVRELTKPITAEEILEATKLQNQYLDYVKKYIYRPNLEQRNYDGEFCVHIATGRDDVEILRHLAYCGADINAREGKSGRTPLHIAIEDGKINVANFLLKECQTLRLETMTFAGLTAYQLAALNENKEILRDLTKLGAEPLSPPDSEVDDYDDDEFDDNMMDRYNTASSGLYKTFNGATAINVS